MSSYSPCLVDSEISVLLSSILSGSYTLSTNSRVKSFLKDLLIWKWNAYNIKKSWLIKKIVWYHLNPRFSMFMMISISNLMIVFLIIHENLINDNIKIHLYYCIIGLRELFHRLIFTFPNLCSILLTHI